MIKVVVFDYGGVLTLGTYTEALLKVLVKKYGVETSEENYRKFDDLIVEFDFGKMKPQHFVDRVNKALGTRLSLPEMRDVVRQARNLNPKVIELVKRTGKKYRVLMLSDNDPINVEILNTEGQDLLHLFEKTYFSCNLKMRKPDKRIFEHLLKDSGLKAEECIFIDDKEKNTRAAEEVGMKSILFKDAESTAEKLGLKI